VCVFGSQDLFFIAHKLGMMAVELGEAGRLEPQGMRTAGGAWLDAGVVVKAVGFETNSANSRMVGRTHMRANGLVARGLWLLVEPHFDGGAFTSPFGSSHLNVVTRSAASAAFAFWRHWKWAARRAPRATPEGAMRRARGLESPWCGLPAIKRRACSVETSPR